MRTIKFIAWDKQNETMIRMGDNKWAFPIERWDLENLADPDLYDDYDVMQFTGLHDKNEKEISE